MERNLIDLNLPNIITITLIAAVGMALIGTIQAFLKTRLPNVGLS